MRSRRGCRCRCSPRGGLARRRLDGGRYGGGGRGLGRPDAAARRGRRDPGACRTPAAQGATRRLAVFSLLLGCGIASVNTYLALFGSQRLGLGPTTAAALVAVLGVAGMAGRVGWSRVADRPGRAEVMPALLAAGAVGAALLLAAAVPVPWLVWVGALAIGSFAVAANAVSMVLVMRRAAPGAPGRTPPWCRRASSPGSRWGRRSSARWSRRPATGPDGCWWRPSSRRRGRWPCR
ncbi:MFS transporter [Streptomyces lydicus]|nr:MFS transporter [Streptomyces lydicus]